MAGYAYLRDKVWTPSGAVILPPLIKKALKDKLDGSVTTTQTTLSRDCPSGKTIYLKGNIAYTMGDIYQIDCIGVSPSNTIIRAQQVEKDSVILLKDVVAYTLDGDDTSGENIDINDTSTETAFILQDAVCGPMVAGTPVIITQITPSVVMPNGGSVYIDSIMAVNPSEFDVVLKVTNTRDKANGNFGNISFGDREAAVIQEALNQIPNATAVLKGYTNATDVVLLEFGLYANEGTTLVPEWDLVLPTAEDLKASVQVTQYVITIDGSGLTQAIDVR